ncbi:hypothetical protein [Streptomyces sp. cg36]|uniref:hypothetical protein n=1 Tax=Streptomyces sp. cg36 TaxID=3238798 RepID=UPI0034E21FE5
MINSLDLCSSLYRAPRKRIFGKDLGKGSGERSRESEDFVPLDSFDRAVADFFGGPKGLFGVPQSMITFNAPFPGSLAARRHCEALRVDSRSAESDLAYLIQEGEKWEQA